MDNAGAEARAKLAARFGNVQLGGKGKLASPTCGLSLWRDFNLTMWLYRNSKESYEEAYQFDSVLSHGGQETEGYNQEIR